MPATAHALIDTVTDDEMDTPPPADDAREGQELASYLIGALDEGERAAVESRLAVDPEYRKRLEELRIVWERAAPALDLPITSWDVDRAWFRIQRPLGREGLQRRAVERVVPWRRLALAASVVLALGIGVRSLLPRLRPVASSAPVAVREYGAPAGQRVRLALADGSRVVLGPGTRMRVPVRFGAVSREVWLDGRAYFEVAHDPSHPFEVHAKGSVARVLGTEFDVRAYPDSGPTQVVVRSGRVAVRAESSPESAARVLVRGDRGVVAANGGVRVESGSNVDDLLGWTQGTLAFRGTPLIEAVPELNRWFDVRIRIDDPRLNGRRITATFRSESLDLVLATVAELVEAQVRRTGKDVVFSSSRIH